MKTIPTDYKKVDIAQYERNSAMIWATRNIRLPKNAPWDFDHRSWQAAIFDDTSKELVVIKPTQIGMTTIMLCKMLHIASFNDVRVMYTLPRQDDVYDLVNGRIESMFRDSPALSSRLGQVDNVRLKIFGNSYLHFMESSVPPRMLDVDCLVNDEVDISNQDHLEQYKARLDASQFKMHWRISTPTLTDFGIDAEFKKSDQKSWLVRCPKCSKDQELDWDTNVKHVNGETWYACSGCDSKLNAEVIQAGRWVAKYPSRSISGYAVSQMMVTSISPNDLWSEYKRMRPKNFYNLRLGKPFAPSTGSITKTLIFDRCINDTHVKEFTGSGYFLGADQGNDIHAVVGKVVNGVLRIVHLEVIPFDQGFNRLHELMEAYKIKKAVIDALPNRHSANDFSKSYRGRKVVVAFYSQIDNTYREDPSDNKVDINRSISFDYLFEKIRDGGIWLYGSKTNLSSELRLAVSHLSSMRRDEVSSETRLGGQKIDIAWINTGPDHFAHAINYLNIAADLGGYDRGFKARPVMSSQEEQRLPPLRAAEVNNSRMPLGKALRGIAR